MTRLEDLRANTNFYSKQIHIRDQLVLNIFVNHDKLDLQGNLINENSASEFDADNEIAKANTGAIHGVFRSISQGTPTIVRNDSEPGTRDVDSSDQTDPESDDEIDVDSRQEEDSKQAAQPKDFTEESKKPAEDEDDVDDQAAKEVINQYRVDIIAQYKDFNDELLLHWAIAK